LHWYPFPKELNLGSSERMTPFIAGIVTAIGENGSMPDRDARAIA
jgi:hypothetical protein